MAMQPVPPFPPLCFQAVRTGKDSPQIQIVFLRNIPLAAWLQGAEGGKAPPLPDTGGSIPRGSVAVTEFKMAQGSHRAKSPLQAALLHNMAEFEIRDGSACLC